MRRWAKLIAGRVFFFVTINKGNESSQSGAIAKSDGIRPSERLPHILAAARRSSIQQIGSVTWKPIV
ncbi:hypothetical protein MCOR26_011502 [Pyricularia oryzae]|nr:hypothetical protein MCOR26_011502 [Pyricularia oryzae]